MTTVLKELAKHRQGALSDYERGLEDGRKQAQAALLPNLEKISADSLSRYAREQEALAAFQGQVVAYAADHYLGRIKMAMSNKQCWKCQRRPASISSPYHLCTECEP